MSGVETVATVEVPYPDADLLFVDDLLTPVEAERLRDLRRLFQERVRPIAADYWNRGEFPFELLPVLAEQNLVGLGLRHGSHLLTGLVQMELTRADTSVGTFFGVHNELFTAAIQSLGSEEQQRDLLPGLLALQKIGSFALTEPDHGSDISRAMSTTARREGDEWVISGRKRWIGNATFADYVLVWARDVADDQIKGFIVETDRPGFSASTCSHAGSTSVSAVSGPRCGAGSA